MNRYSLFFNRRDVNFLYARGDEPWANRSRWRAPKFSLRTWRWTGCKRYSELKIMIFSTHVEMNRPNNFRILMRPDFLYARGDEPAERQRFIRRNPFSLRTWRWTANRKWKLNRFLIFSTHVEMNRSAKFKFVTAFHFLYARGDEPRAAFARGLRRRFSLRTWRWTEIEDSIKLHGITFSNFNTRLAIEQSSNFYLL